MRRLIHRHEHFDIHCGCVTVDPLTIDQVFQELSPTDIDTLIALLSDQDPHISSAVASLLRRFGQQAVPMLVATRDSQGEAHARAVQDILDLIDLDQRWTREHPDR